MNAVIERVKLQNFKSIVDLDLELRPLNVLIGRNGAGKSNFLNFFQLLQRGANESFNATINSMGGFGQVVHYTAQPSLMQWELEFTGLQNAPKVYYTGEVLARGSANYTIKLEELAEPPRANHQNRYKYLTVTNGHVRILKQKQEEGIEDESDQELVISQIRDRSRYSLLSEVRSSIADWQIFKGFGSEDLRNVRDTQLFNAVEPLRLDQAGTNLVSVLQQLANVAQYSGTYERMVEILEVVFPDFVKFTTPIIAGGRGVLNYRSIDFPTVDIPALSMSDGQLRFIGLVVLLLLPTPPPLLVIDEPEIGLHPEMMHIFAELLQDASTRTQIIVATHSPRLIDFIQPQDVVVVEKQDGTTQLARLSADNLERWLERYTLGTLWMMGRLATT